MMSKIYKVAVIGGGAAGLVAANALTPDVAKDSVIFEKLDRVGKKILSTGNGRGNFTNEELSLSRYHGGDPSFAEYVLKKFDNRAIREFFEKKGVPSRSENGRVYPQSLQANALLDALRLDIGGIEIKTDCAVKQLSKNGSVFRLKTVGGVFFAENVILCGGGCAAKNFGTDGNAYFLAEAFGHKRSELYPSLVQMRTDREAIKGLKGIKCPVNATLFDGKRKIATTFGDLLFTDNGVSGNTAFYLSAYLGGTSAPRVSVDFCPNVSEEDLLSYLKNRRGTFPDQPCSFLLSGTVHTALSGKIARSLFGNGNSSELTDGELERAVKEVKEYHINIVGTNGFDYAQVTHGGIITADIDDKTMMSKLCDGLYLCGEIVDIDGDCGGYNLQWAFSSASACAENINERYIDR